MSQNKPTQRISNQTRPINMFLPYSSKNKMGKMRTNPAAPRNIRKLSICFAVVNADPDSDWTMLKFHTATLVMTALQTIKTTNTE
jgi:hypothetical protein